jgi:signal transduction histidine kinase
VSQEKYLTQAGVLRKAFLAAAVTVLGLELLAHSGVLAGLFSPQYLPHRFCYLQQPWLVWTNVTMDGLIAISYGSIFLSLFWVAGQLRSIQDLRTYLWILIAFGTFIVACGATHLMELVTVWWPVYPLSAVVKVFCAAASVPTAILFVRAAPGLATNIRHFLHMLSTTQQEKDQAVGALLATEKLAVAGRISASISHEIKNPLETAGNLLYLLSADPRMPSDLVALAKTASSELKRADEIAQSNLSLLRKSSAPVQVSLAELVDSVLDLQTAQLIGHGISLQRRLRTPLPLKAYSSELRQILINLIQNAMAAIGSRGRIIVRVQLRRSLLANYGERESIEQPGYSITIADTGPGINPTHRPQLFTMFFTTKGDEGTGMGLWLVRSMVEKQGGRIRFRSRTAAECDKPGTIFNIWIPLEPAPIATVAATERLSTAAAT